MSPGSEPERDDPGLPPVDIEIPDDARELDRDVQAYHRELRAVRRQVRRSRWHRSLGRDGIILPLLACCLILALITGTLLTVFTATSEQGLTGLPGSDTNSGLASGGAAAASALRVVPGRLPARAAITLNGEPRQPVREMRQAMLVLVPPNCACGNTLAWLAEVALSSHAQAYLVYNKQTSAEVRQLFGQLDYRWQSELLLAKDSGGLLTKQASLPTGVPATKLTAVLVSADRTVHYATGLNPYDNMARLVQAIID